MGFAQFQKKKKKKKKKSKKKVSLNTGFQYSVKITPPKQTTKGYISHQTTTKQKLNKRNGKQLKQQPNTRNDNTQHKEISKRQLIRKHRQPKIKLPLHQILQKAMATFYKDPQYPIIYIYIYISVINLDIYNIEYWKPLWVVGILQLDHIMITSLY